MSTLTNAPTSAPTNAPNFDPGRFKALERAGFNRIAARYAEGAHLRADLSAALLRAADLAPGQQVLDLASGPGLLAREAARHVQPGGWVLATDIAENMLAEGLRRSLTSAAADVEAVADVEAENAEAAAENSSTTRPDRAADVPAHDAPPATIPVHTPNHLAQTHPEPTHLDPAHLAATHRAKAHLAFAATDAEHLCLADAGFDRVLAGLSLFAFPHPEQALAEIRRVLRPGGKLALSVWGPRATVPLISCAQDCIARLLPPPRVPRPSVFRFGDADMLANTLRSAGFRDIDIAPCRFSCHFDNSEEYWQAFLDLAGGAAESLSRLPDDLQTQLRTAVETDLLAHRDQHGEGFSVDALALVATGRA